MFFLNQMRVNQTIQDTQTCVIYVGTDMELRHMVTSTSISAKTMSSWQITLFQIKLFLQNLKHECFTHILTVWKIYNSTGSG